MQGKSLKDVFHSFTGGKPEMESKVYAKLYDIVVFHVKRKLNKYDGLLSEKKT